MCLYICWTVHTLQIRYTSVRRQTSPHPGEPELQVLDYQNVAFDVLPMLASAYALIFMVCPLKYSVTELLQPSFDVLLNVPFKVTYDRLYLVKACSIAVFWGIKPGDCAAQRPLDLNRTSFAGQSWREDVCRFRE